MKQLLILILLMSTNLVEAKISGKWRQVFPEENGEIPGPRYNHYMTSIGDEYIIMIGGLGGGEPFFYSNETWLYSHKENKWKNLLLILYRNNLVIRSNIF